MSTHNPYAAPRNNGAPDVYEAPAREAAPEEPKLPDGTVREIIEWIGEDRDRAELARKTDERRGVINYATELLGE